MPRAGVPLAVCTALAMSLAGCGVDARSAEGGSATTEGIPPSTSESPTSAPRPWEDRAIELHIDGQISVDGGEPLTRGTRLVGVLGRPDRTTTQTMCGDELTRNTLYRWGDLVVTVLDQQPAGPNILGWSRGSIIGWDLAPDGADGGKPAATGPEGVTIGADLTTVERAFDGERAASVETNPATGKREFGVWYGDSGVGFVLDSADRVAQMYSGHSCAPR